MVQDFLDQLGITGSPKRKKRKRSVSSRFVVSQPAFVSTHKRTRRKKTTQVRSHVRRQKKELDFLDQLGITGKSKPTFKKKTKKKVRRPVERKVKRQIERGGGKVAEYVGTKAKGIAERYWERRKEKALIKKERGITKIPAQRFKNGKGITLGARPFHRPTKGIEFEERMKARKAEREREPTTLVPGTIEPITPVPKKRRGLVSRMFLRGNEDRNG